MSQPVASLPVASGRGVDLRPGVRLTRRSPDWLLNQLPVGMLSSDFFVRFVSLFQELGTTLLENADNVDHLPDVSVAPDAVVRWLGSWIGMISVNAAYDFLRGAGRRPLLDKVDGVIETSDEGDHSPLERLIEKERWDHLNEVLSEFSDKDRHFVELYYQKGLEADEIAAEMQISLKTVYSKKHKIRAHLMRCLEKLSESPIADLAAA